MAADRRDSVRSVIEDLGIHGALLWSATKLASLGGDERDNDIRRTMIALAKDSSDRLMLDIRRVRRLARCHASGLRTAEQQRRRSAP